MINLLKKMAMATPLQKAEDVLEDAHVNSKPNQATRVIRKLQSQTRRSMNHETIRPNHLVVVEAAVIVDVVAVAVAAHVVVGGLAAVAVIVEMAIADAVDIEVDGVAAVAVKEVTVPLANKKSKLLKLCL